MRAISVAIVLAAASLMSCCSLPVSVRRPGDPETFGRLDAISSSDYRALLTAAQERQKRMAPHSKIHDICIASSTEATVLVYTSNGAFYIFVQKRDSSWRVTATRPLNPEDILL
jgi:hypothetical protein